MSAFDFDELLALVEEPRQGEIATAVLGLKADEEELTWQRLCELLRPTDSFELHSALYKHVYRNRGSCSIRPLWLPTKESRQKSNIAKLMQTAKCDTYDDLYKWSIGPKSRSEYWESAIAQLEIKFETAPSSIFDTTEGIARATYLPDARLNIAKSCFRRPSSDVAIVFANESEPTVLREWTFKDLDRLSNQVANALQSIGLVSGDTMGICMPMSAECIAIYLGMVKAGVTVVSIADSFSAIEIETRLRLSKAKGIFTQDVIFRGAKYLGLYERVLEALKSLESNQSNEQGPLKCVVVPGMLVVDGTTATHPSAAAQFRPAPGLDIAWTEFLQGGGNNSEYFEPVILPASHATNILFSSGTTGEPKAIVWSQATPIKAAIDGAMHQDVKMGEVVCWPTNIGTFVCLFLTTFFSIIERYVFLTYSTPNDLICSSPKAG